MKDFIVEEQPSQTLAKALVIINRFSSEKPSWGVRELAREMGENHGTVFRLLKTLQNAGYLIQEEETKRYALGPRIMKLANVYVRNNPLPSLAIDIFKKHSGDFKYNFYLGTLNNYEVIYLAVLDGRGPIKIVVDPGSTTVLHTTALGKVILAYNGDQFISEYIETVGLDEITKNSITDPNILWEQIVNIRKQGYAINNGEQYIDIGAIGVPVFKDNKNISMGVSLAYPQHLVLSGSLDPEGLLPLISKIANEIDSTHLQSLDSSPFNAF